jgi:hypothetical protein
MLKFIFIALLFGCHYALAQAGVIEQNYLAVESPRQLKDNVQEVVIKQLSVKAEGGKMIIGNVIR